MAEYIEREAVMTAVKEWEFSIDDFDCVVQELEQIPSADVAPVVHGEWEFGGWHRRICSCCSRANDVESNYCPNCGAKMDGGTHD